MASTDVVLMDKRDAVRLMQELIDSIEGLSKGYAFSRDHMRWLMNAQDILADIFGKGSTIYRNFMAIDLKFIGVFPASVDEFEEVSKIKNQEAYLRGLEIAEGIIRSGLDLIQRKGMDNIYKPSQESEIVKIVSLTNSRLRKLIRIKPTKEEEINDAIENLFIASGMEKDFERERTKISYSSKTYIPDFVFERISTIVEGKLCDDKSRLKDMISEINDDILAYKTKYENIIFVVYDLGVIRDQDQFREDIESQDHIIVLIIKH
jgi:hypothetical protein